MNTFRLIRVQGPQAQDMWSVPIDRPVSIGRSVHGQAVPDIDLWPDGRVSRAHIQLRFENGNWRIQDGIQDDIQYKESTHGTLLGDREIRGQGPVEVETYYEIRIGDTVLMLVPPNWHRLRRRDLVIELECVPAINFSLAQCGLPIISRLLVRNWGRQSTDPIKLDIGLPGFGHTGEIPIPRLQPGESLPIAQFKFQLAHQSLEHQIERKRTAVSVRVEGQAMQSERIECRVLAYNEWSHEPAHRMCLGAFVLPNHPLVVRVALDATQPPGTGSGPRDVLAAVHDYLFSQWHLRYLYEPPTFEWNSQKVRFPHQVLLDYLNRSGQGTCIDLALLIAACLEYLGHQPLIAIVVPGEWAHALVGCWEESPSPMEPVESVIQNKKQLLRTAVWLDPNACTRDPAYRLEFSQASAKARQYLEENPFVFALDVSVARQSGIAPLPFSGEPQWSEPVAAALAKADEIARAGRANTGTVHMLIGLLGNGEGIAAEVLRQCAASPQNAVQQLEKRFRGSPQGENTERRPTLHYEQALACARSLAKRAGSPMVLEDHLLRALLETPSSALDKALTVLGTSRKELLDALKEIQRLPSTLFASSAFSFMSELR